MKLDYSDKISPTWVKLAKHWNEELQTLRYQLEGDKTELQTAKLRGRIAEIKANLSLEKEEIALEVPAAPE